MKKTENFALSQWEAHDPIRREDFNADNAAIDAALGTVPKIVVGTYTGSGAASKTIALGFRPRAVYAMGVLSQTAGTVTSSYAALAVEGTNFTNALTITDTGFIAICAENMTGSTYFPSMNVSNLIYVYVAVG